MQLGVNIYIPTVKFRSESHILKVFRLHKDKILGLNKKLGKVKVLEQDNDEDTSEDEIEYQTVECLQTLDEAINTYKKKKKGRREV